MSPLQYPKGKKTQAEAEMRVGLVRVQGSSLPIFGVGGGTARLSS